MGWGIRRQPQQQTAAAAAAAAERGGGKGKAAAFSFSPLSWIGKLTARSSHGKCGGAKNAPAASMAGPSCRLPKRAAVAASSVVAAVDDVAAGRSSPPRRSPVDVAPRRLSVGNDSAEAVAQRLCQQQRRRRRHCSLGGDRDLPPLGHLIPFSLAGSPASQPPENAAAAGATPSDTDAGAKLRTRRHRRRAHRRRRSSLGGSGRRSFSVSGRMPAVRIRPPRATAAPELERLAVVRRTRDPQRAFRESMVEMIASSGGSIAARPEELERLLACYLALNADEHHDCIVKVFRQVWFEYINLHLHLSRRRRARHC
uniref:Transcription repressor n=1 Tax=Oryza meridionalis TaxID=40149 RepID=A0A0E0DTX5_9ORYZ